MTPSTLHLIVHQLDSKYNIARTVSPVGHNIHGDLHEFKITQNHTALITFYNTTNADLTSMGMWRPAEGWISDSGFQEIDIATGELLFEWKASEHFSANESYMTNLFAGYTSGIPFDFFHINSVDKDSQGNYIVSSRHFHTVTCITPTGETLWVLGGRYNEFTDLSNGEATNFRWQHDARWLSEEDGIMTLFDNQDAGPLHLDAAYSRGMMIQVDVPKRTAKLLHSYVSLKHARAPSQGSLMVLPETQNVLVGWGASAGYSEFSPNGTLLCESHFGASLLDFYDFVASYRIFKSADWIGTPEYSPAVKIQDDKLYVSWNGATEVVAWELQGAEIGGEGEFEKLDVVRKEAFEESFILPSGHRGFRYRVAALDRNDQVLHYSEVTQEGSPEILPYLFFALFAGTGLAGGVWCCRRGVARRIISVPSWALYKYQRLR